MKLAKIEHYRCGERDTNNYVWVPDEMTLNEFSALIGTAKQDCLDAEKKVEGVEAPRQLSWWDFFEKADPNKTLMLVKVEYAEHAATYKAWEAKRNAARKPFWERLRDLSGGKVLCFGDGEFALEAECNWGHAHGARVDYREESDL